MIGVLHTAVVCWCETVLAKSPATNGQIEAAAPLKEAEKIKYIPQRVSSRKNACSLNQYPFSQLLSPPLTSVGHCVGHKSRHQAGPSGIVVLKPLCVHQWRGLIRPRLRNDVL